MWQQSAFCERLKKLRLASRKSQERVARELNITRSCYTNYELGNREPEIATVVKMAEVFGVLTDHLLGRSGFSHVDFCEEEVAEFVALRDFVANRSPLLVMRRLTLAKRRLLIRLYMQIAEAECQKSEADSLPEELALS